MTNHPLEMFKYNTWANQTIIAKLKELPCSVLNQEVTSSFPTIARTLSHIYAVDKMWYLVLTGMGMREAFQVCMALNERVLASAEEYATAFAEIADEYNEWFDNQGDLEQTIQLDNPFAGARETRLSEIVLQVVNHGTYHRGNMATMLRQLGHTSTMSDYALFWYQGSPGMNER